MDYDLDIHIAEIYDQVETSAEDVELLLQLIDGRQELRILEPFCGTGRILIPLAQAGHKVTGLDRSAGMLAQAQKKISGLPRIVQGRIQLRRMDVLSGPWPEGFDLLILGGNCLYELATPEQQETVIRSAAGSLAPGGFAFIDNNHMEGPLDPAWQSFSLSPGDLSGNCADGTRVENVRETTWFDRDRRLARFIYRYRITLPGGQVIEKREVQQKHPISAGEVRDWLQAAGLVIEALFGDRSRAPYTPSAPRAIFWARQPSQI